MDFTKSLEKLKSIFWDKFIEGLVNCKKNKYIYIGLSGGNSLIEFYKVIKERFAEIPSELRNKIIFFYLDERIVDLDSKDSNYKLTMDVCLSDLINRNLIDKNQILIPKFDGFYGTEIKKIDIALFGIGDDGHIASLFPNLKESEVQNKGFIFIKNSPKLPKERITISYPLLKEIKYPFLFFIGSNKLSIYNQFINNISPSYSFPASFLKLNGNLRIFGGL